MENSDNQDNNLETLEEPGSDKLQPDVNLTPDNPVELKKPPFWKRGVFKKTSRLKPYLNIYLLLFFIILIMAVGFTYRSYSKAKKTADDSIKSQPLSQAALNDINKSDLTIGDAKQTLGIKSNTVFSGKVLVRDNLDVAGTIKVGGSLNLPGITVSGTSVFDQIQGNKLSVNGDAIIQGQVSIQKSLVVSGTASFGGNISAPQITIQSLQLSNDLLLNRHIDAGGSTPTKSDGSALGSGGTSSVSGSDTAGTITINLGGSPPSGGGCFATVNFAQKFNATPHISVTPVGSIAADLRYYVNRSSTSFSLCANNNASGGNSFSFDYIIID